MQRIHSAVRVCYCYFLLKVWETLGFYFTPIFSTFDVASIDSEDIKANRHGVNGTEL